VIVVPEHGDDRDGRATAAVGEHRSLLGEPVRREVAREQDQIHSSRDLGNAPRQAVAVLLRGMEVTDGRDTEHAHPSGVPARRFDVPGLG
jgi:hypothetical protein